MQEFWSLGCSHASEMCSDIWCLEADCLVRCSARRRLTWRCSGSKASHEAGALTLAPHLGWFTVTTSPFSCPPVRLWLASSSDGGPAGRINHIS